MTVKVCDVPSVALLSLHQSTDSYRRAGFFKFLSLLGEVEGVSVSVKAFDLQHPLLARSALVQLVYSHYLRSLLPQVLKLIGSSNVLGELIYLTWSCTAFTVEVEGTLQRLS